MGCEKLKVLILATTFPRWEGDTVPQFIYELAKELRTDDIEPIVLAPHYPGAERKEIMSGVTVYRYPYFVPFRYQSLVFQGYGGILPSIKNSHLAKIQTPFLGLSLLIHSLWIAWKEDVDVVNSHWLIPNGCVGALLLTLLHLPHVLTLHARGVVVLDQIPFGTKLVNYIYSRSDTILPVSTHIRDEFIEASGGGFAMNDRFRVQPMGAHTDEYDIGLKQELRSRRGVEGIQALFVGRLAEKKGVRYLIDIMELLSKQDGVLDDFHLTIVGTGPLENELREYAEQQGLMEHLSFAGWVSDEELREQYIISDFVIVPSIETASGDIEGMPTVISEAFASGNPVIATDVGGIPDVVDTEVNGFIVDQKDAVALAAKTEHLIDDAELRQQLSQGALESAEKLDWKKCGETYTNILKDVHSANSR